MLSLGFNRVKDISTTMSQIRSVRIRIHVLVCQSHTDVPSCSKTAMTTQIAPLLESAQTRSAALKDERKKAAAEKKKVAAAASATESKSAANADEEPEPKENEDLEQARAFLCPVLSRQSSIG